MERALRIDPLRPRPFSRTRRRAVAAIVVSLLALALSQLLD